MNNIILDNLKKCIDKITIINNKFQNYILSYNNINDNLNIAINIMNNDKVK